MDYRKYDENLRHEIEAYFGNYSHYLTHACSFNYMQYANDNKISPEQAWRQFEYFCKYLNRLVYGEHTSKRGKKSLVILPVLEGEVSGKHLHFHCAIGCTDKSYSFEELKIIINTAWRKQKWTYNNPTVKPYKDNGWISYMCKESVRLDLNNVDLTRCCIPADSQMK
jgi:hypothetical protein